MNNENNFKENGNAQDTSNICSKYNVPMFRYEAITSFCVEQLASIHVTQKKGDEKTTCELIFRFVVDVPNNSMISYSLLSNQREDFDEDVCFVIRKMIWRKRNDIEQIMKHPDKRNEYLLQWPCIDAAYVVKYWHESAHIKELISEIDYLTRSGVNVSLRDQLEKTQELDFRNIEWLRRYDWGETRTCCGMSMKHIGIEKRIVTLMDDFNIELDNSISNVFFVEFDYIIPLDEFPRFLS
jgi:hypothetical protein